MHVYFFEIENILQAVCRTYYRRVTTNRLVLVHDDGVLRA